MAASANVTQWLAWALMILTDSMNRPGGYWFHPGFAHQLEAFELPGLAARRLVRTRADAAGRRRTSFLGEWPCAVLADEIRAGNIRAVLNLGGHLLTAFPDANDLEPALRELEVFATIEIIANDDDRDLDPRAAHEGPARAGRRDPVGLPQSAGRARSTRRRSSIRSATGVRRGGCSPSSDAVSGTSSPTPASDDATDDAQAGRRSPTRGRRPFERARRRRLGRGRPRDSRAVGRRSTSSAWAAGGSRRSCSSTSWPRSTCPDALVLVPRRQVRHLNSQFDYLGEPAEVVRAPGRRRRRACGRRRAGGRAQRARRAHRGRPGRPVDPPWRGVGAARPPGRQREPAHQQGRPRPDHRDGAVLGDPGEPPPGRGRSSST